MSFFRKERVAKHMARGGITGGAMLCLTFLLVLAVRGSSGFAVSVYTPFSRAVSGWLGFIFSFTALSAAELLLYALTVSAFAYFILAVVFVFLKKSAWPVLRWLFDMLLACVVTVFIFFLVWGCNYFSPKLEERLELQTQPQAETVLFETAKRHLREILHYEPFVPRDGEGAVDAGGFDALAPLAAESMRALARTNGGIFSGAFISPPKRVLAYPAMSSLGISGIYIPFTGECNVNIVNTDPFLPSTMCHELAHRLSFAPEEDANLVAYLACMESEEPVFCYSGALLAFTYCYNALSDSQLRAQLWAELPQTVAGDFLRNSEAWKKYESPLREKASVVNDSYLKAMRQSEGIKSYGRVVDMLIALYLKEETRQ